VLISKLVITCAVGGLFGGLTGAKLTEYQYRVLLLLRIPPNIRRTHLPGKEVSAGLDPNWSDSDTFYIIFP
jgi:hypothetical protein